MDSTESLLLLVVVPVVAWAAALLVLRGQYQDVQRDWASRGQTPPFLRIALVSMYGAVPTLFGVALWLLSLSFTDALQPAASQAAADAEALFFWAAVANAAAACCAVAGQAIVVRGRLSSFLGTDFGRVLPISVIPFTDSVFALVLAFLAFGYLDGIANGAASASTAAVGSAVAALQAYAVASVAIPVAAAASNRVRLLSARGFSRALLVAELGELPIILGLVMGFLALRVLAAA